MALYHTYRPTTFADVAYQAHIIDTLKNQVIHGKVGHAYLFAGPRGVGKTTTARILAKAVNLDLTPGTAEFDETSDIAKEINESRSIDIIEIDAASHTGVDNVREHIIDNARFQPTSLKKKVFIIDEVHMLSNSAFNALLKTLEEPPAHVMFILATTELHKIPDTILSRCQVFHFKRVPFEEMKTHLKSILVQEKVEVDDDVLERIISKSDGCVRDAMSLLEQVLATGETHITKESVAMFLPTSDVSTTLGFLSSLLDQDIPTSILKIHTASADGIRMELFAHDCIELLRVLMIFKATGTFAGAGTDLNESAKKTITALASTLSHSELVDLIDICMKRQGTIATSPIPELPIELIVLEWCSRGERTTTPSTASTPTPASATPVKTSPPEKKSCVTPTVEDAPHVATSVTIEEPPTEPTIEKRADIVPEATAPTTSVDASFDITEVRKHWPTVMNTMEAVSPTLVFILKMATCTKVEKNTITLEVGYTFHRDKLIALETKRTMEQAFNELLKSHVSVDVIVKEGQTEESQDDSELTSLTSAFGGQVI
jgi:DNA polymerase-3 subunit gamma/tau